MQGAREGEGKAMGPQVLSIKRAAGAAGQVGYTAIVQYEGEEPSTATFVGSTYGAPGPVVMVMENGHQVFVRDPERFGERFEESWVRRFFGEE